MSTDNSIGTDLWHRFCTQFNHWDEDYLEDPYPILAHMRGCCPVVHSDEHGGYTAVTSYAEVLAAAQDPTSFSSALGTGIPAAKGRKPHIPGMVDPPAHREFRSILNPFFTKARVQVLEPAILKIADGLIDSFVERGSCEIVSVYAGPLPGLVFFTQFLGITDSDTILWVRELVATMLAHGPGEAEAAEKMEKFTLDLIDERERQPRRNDVIDAVLHARLQGRALTRDEQIGMIDEIMFGGLDTTALALANALRFLGEHPEHRARIIEDPDWCDKAIEEFLRFESPAFSIRSRMTTVPATIGQLPVPVGERVLLVLGSANRDAAVFEEPDRWNPDRSHNRHLAFGAGVHRCLGSHLARLQFRVGLVRLLQRIPDYEVVGVAMYHHRPSPRGVNKMTIRFTPARAGE